MMILTFSLFKFKIAAKEVGYMNEKIFLINYLKNRTDIHIDHGFCY